MNKLDILHSNNVISELAFEETTKLHQIILKKYNVDFEDQEQLLIHLSMAITRMEKEEKLNKISDDILNEIKKSKYIEEADDLIKKNLINIQKLNNFEIEKDYILLHLVTIIEKKEG